MSEGANIDEIRAYVTAGQENEYAVARTLHASSGDAITAAGATQEAIIRLQEMKRRLAAAAMANALAAAAETAAAEAEALANAESNASMAAALRVEAETLLASATARIEEFIGSILLGKGLAEEARGNFEHALDDESTGRDLKIHSAKQPDDIGAIAAKAEEGRLTTAKGADAEESELKEAIGQFRSCADDAEEEAGKAIGITGTAESYLSSL
jgi:hypothetical protein